LLIHEQLTEAIIGACIEVGRELGPGLLESAYEECLCHELTLRGLSFAAKCLCLSGTKGSYWNVATELI
jgi:GxxExxY protein